MCLGHKNGSFQNHQKIRKSFVNSKFFITLYVSAILETVKNGYPCKKWRFFVSFARSNLKIGINIFEEGIKRLTKLRINPIKIKKVISVQILAITFGPLCIYTHTVSQKNRYPVKSSITFTIL